MTPVGSPRRLVFWILMCGWVGDLPLERTDLDPWRCFSLSLFGCRLSMLFWFSGSSPPRVFRLLAAMCCFLVLRRNDAATDVPHLPIVGSRYINLLFSLSLLCLS